LIGDISVSVKTRRTTTLAERVASIDNYTPLRYASRNKITFEMSAFLSTLKKYVFNKNLKYHSQRSNISPAYEQVRKESSRTPESSIFISWPTLTETPGPNSSFNFSWSSKIDQHEQIVISRANQLKLQSLLGNFAPNLRIKQSRSFCDKDS
jgi:hypothetical protein